LSELTQAIILLNKIGWGWTDSQTTMIDLLKTDEDDDSKWCICGHHIVSHIEDGAACKDKFCYGNCKEFIPSTIMSAQECLKRYRLLLPVLRERFVIKNSKVLRLFKNVSIGSDFRSVIDKCLQLEDIDEYELRNHVVRNIMKPNNLNNLTELDIYLKQFHELCRPLIYSKTELARTELNRREVINSKQTTKEYKRLIKEEFEPKYNKKGWSIVKDQRRNRLLAISSSNRFNGKRKTIVIGQLPEDLAWREYLQKLWILATKKGCQAAGFGWCLDGLSFKRIKEFNAIRYIGLIAPQDQRNPIAVEACKKLGVKYLKTYGTYTMNNVSIEYKNSVIAWASRKIRRQNKDTKRLESANELMIQEENS
jgi:hypothetical protein